MNTIKIHDKYFKPFISSTEIDVAISKVATKINKDMENKTPIFLVILNGSFMFASDLLKKVELPCEISFVKLASYEGTSSTETVRQLIGFDEDLTGRSVVIIEDIIDSGITMENVLGQLETMGAEDVKIATLLFKPDAFRKDYKIDYVGLDIPNDFIVGYGLDYDGQGRNLKDIYKITDNK
ncbi:MAG: hypoxanthine phosphoribosyltransferase [Bacteroidales bacterium]|jgi:hypoxanthine phosphoribosyltransferase|nr:hypoxanthine phosphoribosyltransferase [Lentimicrobiaceae bacterium]MDG1136350.1 hypoxanthine phosphoribosyltransferase [Bacteroidales bacterium]MDG1902305.1 hypoxanthine phosphoribosyltransferase [Bacteroidales bacterium]MDG2081285.1 hypoxanthine phosphoribosyltransferase [Bacteroidales bacterium]|tara:strand:+ start:20104 stop:20646 length:543 start_codon:yes stop_codon:yes gene_type:complete